MPARSFSICAASPNPFSITLAPSAGKTTVSWAQAFESADVASRIEHIVVPANEQNLDRLSAEVLRKAGGG
jgi:hypothetical protein